MQLEETVSELKRKLDTAHAGKSHPSINHHRLGKNQMLTSGLGFRSCTWIRYLPISSILILVIISPGTPIIELTILRATSSSNPNQPTDSTSNPTAFHSPVNPVSSASTKKKKKRKLDSTEESRTKPDGSSSTKSKAKDSNVLSFSRFMEKVRPGQSTQSSWSIISPFSSFQSSFTGNTETAIYNLDCSRCGVYVC